MKNSFKNLLSGMLVLFTFVCVGIIAGVVNPAEAFTRSSPYSGVGYSTYYHNDNFTGRTILNGVDVSEYQPASKVNWSTAKANGVQFAILRVCFTGYGAAGNKVADTSFGTHYRKAKEAGIPVGVYVFSQATSVSEAVAEANYAISILQANGIGVNDLDLPVYMDYEYAGGSDGRMDKFKKANKSSYQAVFTACADAFCKTIADAGYTPGIYASVAFMQGSGAAIKGSTLGSNAEMWAAQYWNKCEYNSGYSMWQYSSAAKIPGINGSNGKTSSVDVNYWYVTDATIIGVSLDNIGLAALQKAGPASLQEVSPEPEEETGTVEGDTSAQAEESAVNNEAELGVASTGTLAEATTDASNEPAGEAEAEEPNTEETAELAEATAELEEGPVEYLVTLNEQASQIGYTMDDSNIYGIVPGTTVGTIKAAIKLDDSLVGYTMQVVNAKTRWVYADNIKLSTGKMLNILDASGTRVASLNLVVNGSASVYATQSYQYDGGVKTPGVVAIFNGVVVANGTDVNNNYVTVSYPGGRTLPGTYTITVNGAGVLSGSVFYASYGISLKNTSITKLTRKSKGFTAKWYKLSKYDAKGYQVQYSRNASMSSSKTKKITSYKKKSVTVTKLSRKKTYYVRIRTYRSISGKTYYSPWSEIRTVKTK